MPEVRASARRLVNCFAEQAPQTASMDSKSKDPPVILRRSVGTSLWTQLSIKGPIRGMHMMEGVLYVVCGNSLFVVNSFGVVTAHYGGQFGGAAISGSQRVYMADNSQCLVIVTPENGAAYTWTLAGTTVTAITDTFYTGLNALKCFFIDSYIVFLQQNGRGFFNDDGQIISGTGPITFTTTAQFLREFGTDPFIGGEVLNRVVYLMGQLTSEAYIDTGVGSAGTPFTSSPQNFLELGCANGNTMCKQNQTLVWVANDYTVRVIDSTQYAQRISTHAIEAILNTGPTTDAYALSFSISGHLFYVLTLPTAGRTLVYDFITQQWHEMSSYGFGYWRPFCSVNAYGMQLVGDSQATGMIGELDPLVYQEYGNPMVATWIHQPVYADHKRIRHKRLEIVLGTGEAPLTGQGSEPAITLQISDDGGHTYRTLPTKDLGREGRRYTRAQWWNLGMSRERVYQFNLSDPLELWLTDVQLETLPASG